MKKFSSIRRAFTLIELLVVISIISLLSSVVLASLKSARSKAKDSKKISQLIEIRTALELYRSVNNTYPYNFSGTLWGNCALSGYMVSHVYTVGGPVGDWIPGLVPKYYSRLPGENAVSYVPLSKGRGNECYVYYSNGTDYKLSLMGGLETLCPTEQSNSFCANPMFQTGRAYSASIYSPGAASFQATISSSY